jgi:hypothetical protein
MDAREMKVEVKAAIPVVASVADLGWRLCSLSGSRDGVCRAIDESKDVPPRWKYVLKDEVAAIPAEFNFIRSLDAHCQVEGGHFIFHSHISPSVALT